MKHAFGFASALLCTGLLAAMPVQAIDYRFIDLSSPYESGSLARAINDSGQVAGDSFYGDATLWTGGSAVPLPGYEVAGRSYAYGINASAQVVGTAEATENDGALTSRATLWNRGQEAIHLGSLGGSYSAATAINEKGQIVGTSFTTGDAGRHAVLWNGGAITDLGSGWATSINRAGEVAGGKAFREGDDYWERAAIWNGSVTPTLLAGPDGGSSRANDINNVNQVVGSAFTSGTVGAHAVVWNDGVATDLGLLDPSLPENSSEARAINDLGQVVGHSFSNVEHRIRATLWEGGEVIDLNSFLTPAEVQAGWLLTEAFDINERGQIVGSAVNSVTGWEHAFLLTPVPEPASVALLLAGLGLVGVAKRRNAGRPVV